MLTILVLLVGLTLATAVIAYWSDNLGKKLGKKRVSLWGMRPRTTATFLTIASSWLIMVFTLGVMLTLFKPLRQALLRYDEVKANESKLSRSAEQLTGQVGGLNAQLATLTDQTKLFKSQVKTASDKLLEVGEKLKLSSQAATRARREQKSAEREAATARGRAGLSRAREQAAAKRAQEASDNLQIVTNQRNATQQQRDAAQSELKSAQTELSRANANVKAADALVKAAEKRVQTAQGKARDAEAQFKTAQADLREVQADLRVAQTNEKTAINNAEVARRGAESSKRLAEAAEKRADEADDRVVIARRQANNAGKQALAAEKQIIAAEKQIIAAEKALEQLETQRKQLISINEQLSSDKQFSDLKRQIVQGNDIRVPVGFTLTARTFQPGLSPGEAEQQLHDIFDYVATKVLPGKSQEPPTPPILSGAELRLASQTVPLPNAREGDTDVYVRVDENDIYDSLVRTISRSQTPLSVRLVADRNHLDGEPYLDVRFIIVPERPALPANTELARATFREKFTDARLFSALLTLADAGREVARQNGVTPPLSPDAKDFFAPGSTEQIFEALRQISALDGYARVRLLTSKEISTTEQLSVKFEVEPVNPVTTQATARLAPR